MEPLAAFGGLKPPLRGRRGGGSVMVSVSAPVPGGCQNRLALCYWGLPSVLLWGFAENPANQGQIRALGATRIN